MPHRDEFPTCPACRSALDARGARLVCSMCSGSLVTDAELTDMLHEMAPGDHRPLTTRLLAEPSSDDPTTERRCPRCAETMIAVTMEGVPFARCPAHGCWFDRDRLAKALDPEADLAAFNAEMADRRAAADRFEDNNLGVFGGLLRALYRAWKARKEP